MVDTLTRPSGTALFVQADRKVIMVRRRIKHHCTREEWDNPIRRLAKIAEAWRLAANIRSEGETLLGPSPVTLYRHPVTGVVEYADVQTHWITPTGDRIIGVPYNRTLLVAEETDYSVWAEGPLAYMGDHAAIVAPDPLQDRSLQRIRHQNRRLMAKIDAAISPDAPLMAVDAGHEEYVDFRIRAICERSDLVTIQSKQTGEATRLVLADGTIEIRDHNPLDLTE